MKGKIYYTGGGVWCAWAKLGKHLWYGGSTDGGCLYRTKQAARESMGDEADLNLIGYVTEPTNRQIWHKLLDEEKISEGMCWYDEIVEKVDRE